MLIIKPKMLKGIIKLKQNEEYLYTAGLILGAMGCDIKVKTSPEFVLNDEQRYLHMLIKSCGGIIKNTKTKCQARCTGLMSGVSADALKCKDTIFIIMIFLCFLKGSSKIFNVNRLESSIKDKLYRLIGNLKKLGADIKADAKEVIITGRQTLNGGEVFGYADFDIFLALCIAAHRCEGNVVIKDTKSLNELKYNELKDVLISLEAELLEKRADLKMMKNIVLTGMSGAGKSRLGKELSKRLEFNFYDSDNEFEKEEEDSISNVFKEKGEEYFRLKESEIIKKLSLKRNCVIATGGGTVLKEENVLNLKKNGIIFYIERDIDVIASTVDGSGRPLFKGGKDSILKLFKERKEIYEKTADCTVSNNGEPEEAVEKIIEIYEGAIK